MSRFSSGPYPAVMIALASCALLAAAPGAARSQERKPDSEMAKPERGKYEPFKVETVTSNSNVTIGGHAIAYQAIAGTLIVHPKGWDDVPRDPNAEKSPSAGGEDGADARNPTAEASM